MTIQIEKNPNEYDINKLEPKTKKGKKGFQRTSKHVSKNITFRLTQEQAEFIQNWCNDNGYTVSTLVRSGIQCYLSALGEWKNADGNYIVDKNQLNHG